MKVVVPVRIQTGAPVRIDGKEYSAGPVISGGRVFYDKEAGTQIVLTEIAQLRMALDLRLRDASPFEDLSTSRRQALRTDWGTFTAAERKIALTRVLFVRKLEKVEPALHRVKKKVILGIIEDVCTRWNISEERRPSVWQVRTWYRIFVTAGRDVRALVPCNWAKGNRNDWYPDWAVEIVNATINKEIVCKTPASARTATRLANKELRKEAAKRGEKLTRRGVAIERIGTRLISRMVRARDRFEVMVQQCDVREARRQYHSVQLGPQGDEVNKEWEVDHCLLDVQVIDEETMQIAGRPWLTAIIDRYSRCIVGFSMSFAHPSWASVMDALRVAISRKDPYLATYAGIKNDWACFGVPGTLVTDHGRDFKSNSMVEAAHALGFRLRHVRPKEPWLKGKIERWFKSLAEEIIHVLPGTVFARIEDRKFYNSEKQAVLTIHELNWIVAKWVIDVYHQRPHSKLGTSPAKMWAQGLKEITPLRDVPDDLLVPMMGLVIPRTLRNGGVQYLGLRWDSEDFGLVRAYLPSTADVQVRIDPLDVSTAYIFDERERKWVEGHLVEPVEARGMTIGQWATVKRLRKMITDQEGRDADEAIAEAITDLRDFVAQVKRSRDKGKAPTRFARYQNRTAWQRVRPAREDADHGPPGAHQIGIVRVKSPPLAPFGPFAEPSQKWKRQQDEPGDAQDPDDEADETGTGDAASTASQEPPNAEKPAAEPRARKSRLKSSKPIGGEPTKAPPQPDVTSKVQDEDEDQRSDEGCAAAADGDDGEIVARRRGYGDAGEE
ncbi:putative transposase [Bradyrhizobium japonicum]